MAFNTLNANHLQNKLLKLVLFLAVCLLASLIFTKTIFATPTPTPTPKPTPVNWVMNQPTVSVQNVTFTFSPASGGQAGLAVNVLFNPDTGIAAANSGQLANGANSWVWSNAPNGNYQAQLTFGNAGISNIVFFSVAVATPTTTPTPTPTPAPGGIQLCVSVDFTNGCETFTSDDPDLSNNLIVLNNNASSVRVPLGRKLSVYSAVNYGGVCETFTSDDPDLRNNLIGNDMVAALRLDTNCPIPTPTPTPTPPDITITRLLISNLNPNPTEVVTATVDYSVNIPTPP